MDSLHSSAPHAEQPQRPDAHATTPRPPPRSSAAAAADGARAGRDAAAADPERAALDAGDARLRRSTADGDGAAADAELEAAVLDTLTDVVLTGEPSTDAPVNYEENLESLSLELVHDMSRFASKMVWLTATCFHAAFLVFEWLLHASLVVCYG